jgi:D-alanine-D-alanine ligase
MDKAKTKDIWKQHNLALSPWIVANIGQAIPEIDFPLPWEYFDSLKTCK